MIKVFSQHLSGSDRILLRRYANIILAKFVQPSVSRRSLINIKILRAEELTERADYHNFKEAKAWMTYDGIQDDGVKKFTVVMNAAKINQKAKKPWIRLKRLMLDLGHEMTHIKQYLNNELFDYKDGKARYKGEVFHDGHAADWDRYFESPWEIEAYGREWGYYILFTMKLKKELKEKNKKK